MTREQAQKKLEHFQERQDILDQASQEALDLYEAAEELAKRNNEHLEHWLGVIRGMNYADKGYKEEDY
jgi:hypothetical protein